jgi:hypothetical protein
VSIPVRMGALLALCVAMASPVGLAQNTLPDMTPSPTTGGLHDDSVDTYDDDAYVYDEDDDYGPQTDLEALEQAHAAYLKKTDLQLKRPEYDAPPEDFEPPKPPPRWLQAIFEFLGNLGPVLQVIFWIAVALVVAGVLYFLFGEALRVRFGRDGKGKVDNPDDVLPDLRPDTQEALTLLEEADALARAGKFAEAVHLLLFRSINDIQQRLEGGVPRSLTAREIGSLRHLPERAKRGLGPIIQIVEHSFFGGRDVDAEGWKTARESYEHFAFGEGWA